MMLKLKTNTRFYSYDEYYQLTQSCAANHTTTGDEQSESRIEATKLNAHRMNRINKQIQLEEKLIKLLTNNNSIHWDWIVISEAWCGDSAQCLPLIHKISELNEGIKLKIILRDENDELINQYSTNGSKSIPKLICLNSLTKSEIGTWGPRPTEIASIAKLLKAQNPSITHDEFVKQLHFWYAKDKGLSLQADLYSLICQWMNKF